MRASKGGRMVRPTTSSPIFFFFNDTATTEIYTLSLHDALPIFRYSHILNPYTCVGMTNHALDRKSTRLNSSHDQISYAVFCLKKKTHCSTSQPRPHAHDFPTRLPPPVARR